MRKCHNGIGKHLVILLILLSSCGCAQQMMSVQPTTAQEDAAVGQVEQLTVSDDASTVTIIADRPIVYTYYMLDMPPRIILDLAQTGTERLQLPREVNKGSIGRIIATRHEFSGGLLSRFEMYLTAGVDASAALDPQDKRKLVITFPRSATQAQAAPPPAEPVPVPATVAPEPALAPAVPPAPALPSAPAPAPPSASAHSPASAAPPAPVPAPIPATAATATVEVTPPQPVAKEVSQSVVAPVPAKAVKSPVKQGERALTAIRKTDAGIQLDLSAQIESYKAFRLSQPERLIIDIAKTRSALAGSTVEIRSFGLVSARIGSAADKLRVVFDAAGTSFPSYKVTKNDSGLFVALNGGAVKEQKTAPAAAAQEPAPKIAAVPAETTPPAAAVEAPKKAAAVKPPVTQPTATQVSKSGPGMVEAVEFSQSEAVSRITIRTRGGCSAGEPVKTAKGMALTMKMCRLPARLQRQLDTTGFDTAIRSIAPFSTKGATTETKIAVNLKTSLANSLKRESDNFIWEFNEPAKKPKPAKVAKKLPAVKSAPADSVTSAASLEGIVGEGSPTVVRKNGLERTMEETFPIDKVSQPVSKPGKVYTGRKVTLEFSDADIRKIFQLLAEVSNQNFLISDDVTGTISLKLVNVPWDQALDVILENKGLGMQRDGNIVQIRPRTKMKSLDDEALEMRLAEEKKMPLSTVIFDINFAALTDIETQFKNLKSKRPDTSISSDQRTNKIIVVDIDQNIRKMRTLLEQLDVPEKQVMIEARIVEASSSFARDLGVKWSLGYTDGSAANIFGINSATGSMGGVVSSVLPSSTTGGLATGVSFGKLINNFQLDMRLSAAATVGQVKIISTPKVLTVNNKAAKISQGQMIPYQNTSSTDGAKTEFIEAALTLEVTPHITADGSVNMKIKASNNSAGFGSPPPINKKEATTELVVKNGETTVIGGIYVDSETESDTGVPYLSDIPLLGNLFKSNSKNKVKNEMLIFITPKIMN